MFGHPHICMPPYICTPPGVYTPHRPPCSSVHLHGFGAFACCGGLLSTLNVCWDTSLTPPLFGVPPLNYTPHTLLLVPCALLFSGILVSYVGLPLLLKGLGVFPITWGGLGGTSALQLSTCSFLYFFCSALCLTF